MKIPENEQYKEFRSHLRYLNEKIIEAFARFISLATAIVGGVFYVHITLPVADPRRNGLALPADLALGVAAVATIIVIWQNLSAWISYRRTLSDLFPEIPPPKGARVWVVEVAMCVLVAISVIGFCAVNPLGRPALVSPPAIRETAR